MTISLNELITVPDFVRISISGLLFEMDTRSRMNSELVLKGQIMSVMYNDRNNGFQLRVQTLSIC